MPVGVPHAWRAAGDAPCRWVEVSAPAPRDAGPPDTFFTGAPAADGEARPLDIRDPRTRTFFRLDEGQMDVDNLKADAPTVSASMATALLADSGITLKMLVDRAPAPTCAQRRRRAQRT